MEKYLEEKIEMLKEKYLNKDFYIMVKHSSYNGDISTPIGTIVDVYVGWMNTVCFKWKKKYELPWNVNDTYEFADWESDELFETEKEAKKSYYGF